MLSKIASRGFVADEDGRAAGAGGEKVRCRLAAEDEERRGAGVGHHRVWRDDAYGAEAIVDGESRARVDDVRVAASVDFDEALVAA